MGDADSGETTPARALLFDLGGVVLDIDFDRVLTPGLPVHPVTHSHFVDDSSSTMTMSDTSAGSLTL
jgi:hypothetical protein